MKTLLKFSKPQVIKLLSQIPINSEITLVGDEGVYLMSLDDKKKPRTIVYAEGCDPTKDEDFYENKQRLFGGDDGADPVGTAEALFKLVRGPAKKLTVVLTPDSITMKG